MKVFGSILFILFLPITLPFGLFVFGGLLFIIGILMTGFGLCGTLLITLQFPLFLIEEFSGGRQLKDSTSYKDFLTGLTMIFLGSLILICFYFLYNFLKVI